MRRLIKFLWITLLVSSCFLLVLPYVSPRFRARLNNFFHPILPDFSERFYSESDLQKENADLKKKLADYEALTRDYNNLVKENRRLRKLFGLELRKKYETVVAEVTVAALNTAANRRLTNNP